MSGRLSRLRTVLRTAVRLAALAAVAGGSLYWFLLAPLEVRIHSVVTGTVVEETLGVGTLAPRVRAAVGARITGRLASVVVDQGDRVTRGQLLATLDDGDLRQQVEIARAELAIAQASIDRATAGIERAKAHEKLFRSSFQRIEALAKKQVASLEDLERATQQRDVALADLQLAELAFVESQRTVGRAERSLRFFEERLGDARIVAPFDGLVVQRDRETGDVVVPGGTIVDIVSTDDVWVSAWVDEAAIGALCPGQPVRVAFHADPGAPLAGRVVRLSLRADPETRELQVDVRVDRLPARWAVGQRALAYIETARRSDVVVLPQRLLVRRGGDAGVWVDDHGVARWRTVVLGLCGRDQVEVTSGLEVGHGVIDSGRVGDALREGRAVRRAPP